MNGRIATAALTTLIIWLFVVTTVCADKIPVYVSILPQKYFVQQIGKDLVHIEVMVQPGASPATYEPKPGQMKAMASARVYFSIGVPFEKVWLGKIAASNPDMLVVPTDRDVYKRPMESHDDHHENETHLKGAFDPPYLDIAAAGDDPGPHHFNRPPEHRPAQP